MVRTDGRRLEKSLPDVKKNKVCRNQQTFVV